jgi:Glyoxalase-like domain
MNCALDHLVVLAASLDEGAAWCEATLGVPAGPGGQHPLMGTHNRLLRVATDAFPLAYLEIIAIDPAAPAPGRARWFNMDSAELQARVKQDGPRLHHAVLRSPNLEMMRWGLINRGLNPGAMLAAERDTPHGRLSWRIVVRDDGRIEADGALPTLIAWNGLHPSANMAPSAVHLKALRARELPAAARDVLRWRGPQFMPAPAPRLEAVFHTPRGDVTLRTSD